MKYATLCPNGPSCSRIITGAWRWHTLSDAEREALIRTSLDCGITTFDHADIYGDYSCEELFGRVLKANPSLRQQMQLVTKFGIKLLSSHHPEHRIKHYDTSRAHMIASVEQSLKNLGTDYLDVLLLHRPDPLMNPEEVAAAFQELHYSGKVRYLGVSNFTGTQFEMLSQYVHQPLVTNQLELSLFKHTLFFDGTVDTLMKNRVAPMAWSPLGGGKYFTNEHSATMQQIETMSNQYNTTVSGLLLAWLLAHPAQVFPIVGSTRPARIQEAATSLNVQLDRQDWFALLKLVTGRDVA